MKYTDEAEIKVAEGEVFTPEQLADLPKISVPDLPEDATGLPPEALMAVPVLTETANETVEADAEAETEADLLVEELAVEAPMLAEVAEPAQEPAPQADTWAEQMQVRMGRLKSNITELTDRLDRLQKN